ncbi:hypothetical protein B0H16DRAFT_1552542, partial [Mycena metata]
MMMNYSFSSFSFSLFSLYTYSVFLLLRTLIHTQNIHHTTHDTTRHIHTSASPISFSLSRFVLYSRMRTYCIHYWHLNSSIDFSFSFSV